ncbi:DUF2007-related protein [uncultured Bacteroides sp.]|jgi:hypothetical protein|uniref:DUF2007-related protein n=1 Tax=uncultured Bacteroides sp. TaxID=162156 RepID=UPI002AA81C04|nr:DUF2007-related protein [uncultured Bacteroides sp.]
MIADDNTPLVEVFTGTPWEAELVKGLLESAGIEAALKDDNLGSMAPSMSVNVGMGGMRVIVAAEDYEVASQLVETRENKK